MQKFIQWTLRHKTQIMVTQLFFIVIGFGSRFTINSMKLFNFSLVIASIIGILPILFQAYSALKVKVVSIDVLVSIAALAAFFIQNFEEAAIVTFLFLFGSWLEAKTLDYTRSSIKELTEMAPDTAWVKQADGSFEEIDVDFVEVDDIIQVKTGGRVPVDGTIIEGAGYLNEASITGESIPVNKAIDDEVYSGSLLENGTVYLRADRVAEDSTFGKILELVEEAQDAKSSTEKFIDQFSKYYTYAVLVIGLMVGLLTRDIELAVTILVLGCPGALVIGVPVSNVAGIGNGAKNGILLKGSETIQDFAAVDTMIFDKTGTLTEGEPKVADVAVYSDQGDQALAYLLAIEKESDHPLARAIIEYLENEDTVLKIDSSEAIKGAGIIAMIEANHVAVGNLKLMEEQGYSISQKVRDDVRDFESKGNSIVLTAVNGKIEILMGIRDQLRAGVKEQLQKLRKQGINNLIVASGDNQGSVDLVANELGLTQAMGNMLPQDKANLVKQLVQAGHTVAFIGDGINDSPSLANAQVGIAMGSGTDIAIETSDVVLVQSDFDHLNHALGLSQATNRNMKQNIVISIGVVVILVSMLLFTPWMSMSIGMLIHEGSILAVILNAMRLLRYKR
ncbi:heavy metal translocating P-type ATPase [Falseniella ignava]|uniref:Cd(2+)-exporting ATPase n=1 Tax=Falseniella ignava CCUG 37419 TaxID=883112 RepID=K1LI51_9LACT|nr:heavy metal translocating P-type ATPase [Falseniella ignava CCUG 37419]